MKIKRLRSLLEKVDEMNDERVDEILSTLKSILEKFDADKEKISSIQKEIESYKSKSNKIDAIDTINNEFELLNEYLDDSIQKLDSIIEVLYNYKNKGRDYLL